MRFEKLAELTAAMQASVSPVILISGIALLLLSMTNRFSRVVDRARELARRRDQEPAGSAESRVGQIRILHRRSHGLRQALTLSLLSILCLSLLVMLLFLSFVLELAWERLLILLFVGSFLCLIGSLGLFIADFYISLKAIDLEINRTGN